MPWLTILFNVLHLSMFPDLTLLLNINHCHQLIYLFTHPTIASIASQHLSSNNVQSPSTHARKTSVPAMCMIIVIICLPPCIKSLYPTHYHRNCNWYDHLSTQNQHFIQVIYSLSKATSYD